MAEAKEPNFEQSMKRLGEIVEHLEAGEASLDDSLKLYEEGVRISKACMKRLEEAQQKIEMLTRNSGGALESSEENAAPKEKARKKSR